MSGEYFTVCKTDRFKVTNWDDNIIFLEGNINGRLIKCFHKNNDEFSVNFNPAYACTIHFIQGDTIDEDIAIHEISKSNKIEGCCIQRSAERENLTKFI